MLRAAAGPSRAGANAVIKEALASMTSLEDGGDVFRLDSKIEIDYYRNNGILQYMLRQLLIRN